MNKENNDLKIILNTLEFTDKTIVLVEYNFKDNTVITRENKTYYKSDVIINNNIATFKNKTTF